MNIIDANRIVKLLNKQEKQIQELKKENEIYKQTLIDFGHYFLVHW